MTYWNMMELIVSYKFASMSKEEIEAMLVTTESEFKQSRLYREIKEEGEREGKLKTVPEFLKLGLSLEQIAQAQHLPIEEIEAAATPNPENS